MDSVLIPSGRHPDRDPPTSGEPRRNRNLSVPIRAVAWVLVPLLFLPSCGYRLQRDPSSRFADPAVRVDLPPFANESIIPDAGAYLASRLREEMVRSGFRGRFDRVMADFLIEGTVRETREWVSSYGADGFAIEYRMGISVDIRVVEVTRGHLLWKEEGIAENASYFAGPDFQFTESNRRMAFEEICRRMARRIGQTLRVIL